MNLNYFVTSDFCVLNVLSWFAVKHSEQRLIYLESMLDSEIAPAASHFLIGTFVKELFLLISKHLKMIKIPSKPQHI